MKNFSHLEGVELKLAFRKCVNKGRVRKAGGEWVYKAGQAAKWVKKRLTVPGFYVVKEPMHVFKKVYYKAANGVEAKAIANLIIPVGTKIYAPDKSFHQYASADARKMRAAVAIVHSIVTVSSRRQLKEATAGWDQYFKYGVGKTVVPKRPFSLYPDQCESGIHFFINLNDALYW